MAPYVINNTTTLLNSPPAAAAAAAASAENNTISGVALVPLGADQNGADPAVGLTTLPYSLQPSHTNMATTPISTTAAVRHEEERTPTGIPISLIWMPYVALTLIIVGLMMASFWKYHKKHGHKYVRRREELAKKHQQALKQAQAQAHAAAAEQNQVGHHPPGIREGGGKGGGSHHEKRHRSHGDGPSPPNGGPSSIEDHTSSRYRNHNQSSTQKSRSSSSANKAPGGTSRQKSTSSGSRSGGESRDAVPSKSKSQSQQHARHPASSSSANTRTAAAAAAAGNRTAPKHPNKRHPKPLTFTKNENGSMVDLRVEKEDKRGSTKMFKQPFQTHKPLSPWTVPPLPGEYSTLPATLPSPSSPLAFSDDDDDHSYLIHQTKL